MNVSIEDLSSYFKNNYTSNNMALFVSGDFDFDMVIKQIDQIFGDLPKGHLASKK